MNGLANSIGELLLPTQGVQSGKPLKSLEAALAGEGGGESFLNILDNLVPGQEISQNGELGSELLAGLTGDLSKLQNIASDLSDGQGFDLSGFLSSLNTHLEQIQQAGGSAASPLAQELSQFLTNNPGITENLGAFLDKNIGNLTPETKVQFAKLVDRLQSLNFQDLTGIQGLGIRPEQSAGIQDATLLSQASNLPAQLSGENGLQLAANGAGLTENSITASVAKLSADGAEKSPELIKTVAGENAAKLSNPLQGISLKAQQQSVDDGQQPQLNKPLLQDGNARSEEPGSAARQSEQQDTLAQIVRSPLPAAKNVRLEPQSNLNLPETLSVPGTGPQTAQGTNTAHVGLFSSNGAQSQAAVPLNAIAVHIASQAGKGLRKFEIRLDPPELGRIDVRLEVARDGAARTHLIVERPETLDMLQRDARALEKALTDSGLQTNRDNLSFSLKNQNFAGNQFLESEDTGKQAASDPNSELEDDENNHPDNPDWTETQFMAKTGLDIRI